MSADKVRPEDQGLRQMGKLAMRVEGDWWVGYYKIDGEEGLELGRISMRMVQNAAHKHTFMTLMLDCFADLMEDVLGVRPVMGETVPAPESERSGSA